MSPGREVLLFHYIKKTKLLIPGHHFNDRRTAIVLYFFFSFSKSLTSHWEQWGYIDLSPMLKAFLEGLSTFSLISYQEAPGKYRQTGFDQVAWVILVMGSTHERRRYSVTSTLIGWAHTRTAITESSDTIPKGSGYNVFDTDPRTMGAKWLSFIYIPYRFWRCDFHF